MKFVALKKNNEICQSWSPWKFHTRLNKSLLFFVILWVYRYMAQCSFLVDVTWSKNVEYHKSRTCEAEAVLLKCNYYLFNKILSFRLFLISNSFPQYYFRKGRALDALTRKMKERRKYMFQNTVSQKNCVSRKNCFGQLMIILKPARICLPESI